MFKKEGRIKAIPVAEVTKGMQVITPDNSIAIVEKIDDPIAECKIIKSNKKSQEGLSNIFIIEHELKTFVVEYEKEIPQSINGEFNTNYYPPYNTHTIKQLPLKPSQWEEVLDNIDTYKMVKFEERGTCPACNRVGMYNCAHFDKCGNNFIIAVMLPTIKK